MSMQVTKEGDEMFIHTGVLEDCFFCRKNTRFWHEPTNNPVCPACAGLSDPASLPNWRNSKDNKK